MTDRPLKDFDVGAAPRAEGPQDNLDYYRKALESCYAERDAIAADEQAAVDELLAAPRAEGPQEGTDRIYAAMEKGAEAAQGAAPRAEGLDGEAIYRAYWSAKWDAGTSTHSQWEQLTASEQAIWRDAAARLSGDEGAS